MSEEIRSGKLISFEGGEGSGKTIQMNKLAEVLRQMGMNVFTTREPGGTPIGDKIRSILIDNGNYDMSPKTETLLFQASRAQIVEQVLKPWLSQGALVMMDRFLDSTLAYQGSGHRENPEVLMDLINFATGGLRPDLTVLLRVRPEIGLARKRDGDEWNRLDAYSRDFHERVYLGYDELVKTEPKRWRVVDAEKSIDEVHYDLLNVVTDFLRLPGVARLGIVDK